MTGKVWLVGAGPGDAGLLTLKGKQVLSEAEVVVYDALVGQGVLSMIPEDAELIFAGKRSGTHYLRQEETNRVLLEEAQKGRRVVRLKGGDPFLFGRGGEELELLAENGIPFEVVPGVTSAIAVPAYNGIPVTHRDYCSSVHIITGHRRADHSYDIDFEALVRTGGTLVFLMGIAALPELCGGLLKAGMDPETPAAVLEKGTTASQGRISATVSTMEAACSKCGVRTPAILVVGSVCSLADSFSWYENRPLGGIKVLLTRPKEQSSRLAALLRSEGAEVLELPAIRTEAVQDDREFRACLSRLAEGGYDWLVFTSPSGVRIFFEKLLEVGDIRSLAGVKAASLGPGTARALAERGLRADFQPSAADGATLGKELAQHCKEGERILIPRASIGNPELVEELRRRGDLQITDLPAYDTRYVASRVIDQGEALESGDVDFAVFTSASTVKGFAAAAGTADLSNVRAICIGKQTAAAAQALGMRCRISEKATLPSLTDCLIAAAKELKESRNLQRRN